MSLRCAVEWKCIVVQWAVYSNDSCIVGLSAPPPWINGSLNARLWIVTTLQIKSEVP